MLPLLLAVSALNPLGHVSDFAHLLSPTTVAQIEQSLVDLETQTGAEVAVVTIDSHGNDETIETYAEKLFQKWGIGKEKEDNGILLLIARDDREMRIEVGYGLESIITDIESAYIISDVLTPAFRAGDFDKGVVDAIDRIASDIGNGEPQDKVPVVSNTKFYMNIFPFLIFMIMFAASILARSKSWWAGGVIGGMISLIFFQTLISAGILIVVGLIFDYVVSKTYKKSKDSGIDPPWWIGGPGVGGGRGGGGGFGGFGGGMSGGGGASGRW